MENKKFLIVLAVIAVGFFGYVMFAGKDKSDESSSTASSQGSTNYYGNMDSKVTLTEFVDYQCEACYAYYPYVKQVKEIYKDRVKFQVRNFPITSGHQFAYQGARSAEAAAKQGKFWEMHDKIYEGQKVWEKSQNPQTYFETYAEEIGLDMAKFKKDRDGTAVANIINKDLADVKALGGDGTPTFVLNGKKIESPQATVESISKVLDDALKQAE